MSTPQQSNISAPSQAKTSPKVSKRRVGVKARPSVNPNIDACLQYLQASICSKLRLIKKQSIQEIDGDDILLRQMKLAVKSQFSAINLLENEIRKERNGDLEEKQ